MKVAFLKPDMSSCLHEGIYSYINGLEKELSRLVDLIPVTVPGATRYTKHFNFTLVDIEEGVDLIHNPTSVCYTLRKFKVPYLLTVADMISWMFPHWMSWKDTVYHNVCGRLCYRNVDKFIAISNSTKSDMVKMGLSENDIDVVYPGVDEIYFHPCPVSQGYVEQMFGIKSPYYLYVGSFNPRKNVDGLIRWFLKHKNGHQLVLAGGAGWNNQETYRLIHRNPIDIVFLENPSTENLRALYEYCGRFVYPSFYEGYGLPLAEALAVGRPVWHFHNSSLDEVAPLHWKQVAEEIVKVYEKCL
jgi:glycosyltransferase involved in cell wall biosynthesis